MPDFVFDLNQPYPDVALDTLRRNMLQALADLADHLEQLADSFLLGQTAADFAQTVLTTVTALQQTVTDQGATVTALQGTVTDQDTTIAALQQTVADQGTAASSLQQTVADLQATVTAQADTITALQGQVADLQTQVAALTPPPPAA